MMVAGASALATGPASAAQAQTAAPYKYKLRYAPRIGLLQGLTVPQQLEVYAKNGLFQFEFNGLPSQSPAEIKTIRDKMDELSMSMGVFVVNRGGWKPTAMGDRGGLRG